MDAIDALAYRREAHVPERGLQPRRLSEGAGQGIEPAGAGASMVESVELVDRAGGDFLVFGAGIHLDPFGVGVAVRQCIGVGPQRRANLGIPDDAGRERDVQIEDISR